MDTINGCHSIELTPQHYGLGRIYNMYHVMHTNEAFSSWHLFFFLCCLERLSTLLLSDDHTWVVGHGHQFILNQFRNNAFLTHIFAWIWFFKLIKLKNFQGRKKIIYKKYSKKKQAKNKRKDENATLAIISRSCFL